MRQLKILFSNIKQIPRLFFCTKIAITAILQDSVVDKNAAICGKTKFYRSSIGNYSYIGNNCFINNTTIGKFSSISGNCYIGGTSHPLDWVSTSSVFHKWSNLFSKNFAMHEYEIFRDTYIGNDVWIGEGVKVKAGVTIGDGVIIGMGSIVTKDLEPYGIYAGNPAKLIRKRFDNKTIEELAELKWWNWNDEKIEHYGTSFNNVEKFLRECQDEK